MINNNYVHEKKPMHLGFEVLRIFFKDLIKKFTSTLLSYSQLKFLLPIKSQLFIYLFANNM